MSIAIQFIESVEAGAGITEPVRFSLRSSQVIRLESFGYHSHIGMVDTFAYTRYSVTVRPDCQRRGIVLSFLKFDNRDLSMMVGMATIVGAASGEISRAFFDAPPMNLLSLGAVLAAFVAGRYMASWLGLKAND